MLLADVDSHRADINGITTLATTDLSGYASTVLDESAPKAAGQLRAASVAVVETYGAMAATSGALFYETQRPTPGFTARLVTPSLGETLTATIGWALTPLFTPEKFDAGPQEAVNRLSQVVQKAVAGADRGTIIRATRDDHTSHGWRRYARLGACAFCAYLSSVEAPVAESTVWHTDCHCVTVPGWAGDGFPHSDLTDRFRDAADAARTELEQQRAAIRPQFAHNRQMNAAHPELKIKAKNIARVMRQHGFAH